MDQKLAKTSGRQPVMFVVAEPEDPVVVACREMVSGALDFCEQKTRLPGREALIRALRAGNPAVHNYVLYALVKEIGSYLGRTQAGVKAVYLDESESEPEEAEETVANLAAGLRIIVWTADGKEGLPAAIEAIDAALARECETLLGPAAPSLGPGWLTADIIDDRQVERRVGSGALIASVHSQLIRVWSRFVIQLNADYCGECLVCSSVCPYEAITINPGVTAAKIDVTKCQVCGICYSACPAGAIEAAYYDFASLARDVQSSVRVTGTKAIALTCRGSTPPADEIAEIVGSPDFTTVCLPCVGRTPPELILKAMSMGIERIAVVPCEDDHCRFEEGSRQVRNRIMLLRSLLKGLHYDPNVLIFRETQGPVASIDADLCTGCGTCIAACAYSAIKAVAYPGRVLLTSEVDPGRCEGCGACVVACPVKAIEMSRFADPQLMSRIETALASRAQDGTPYVLGFRCNWCSYGDLDLPFERLRYSSQNIEVIRVPCAGRVDPLHVLWAFLNGADGVYLGGCPSGDCRYLSGTDQAEHRVARLKQLLEGYGFDSRRLRLDQIKRDSPEAFGEAIKEFASEIRQLGVWGAC